MDVQDPARLLDHLNEESGKKFKKLNGLLCETLEDFSLVAFQTLNIMVR